MNSAIIHTTLCYLFQGDKVLLLKKEKSEKVWWTAPGGKLEKGESPEEGNEREFLEETGLKLINPSMKGVLFFPPDKDGPTWWVFVFIAKAFSGELKSSTEGEPQWLSWAEALKKPAEAGDITFLPRLREAGFFSGKLSYENGVFKEAHYHTSGDFKALN